MEPNNNPVPEAPVSETPTSEAPTISAEPIDSPKPTPQPEPKPAKSNKPLIWCLAILAIIGIVAAIVFAYLYFTTPTTPAPTPNNNQSSTTPDEPTTTEEIEITDALLKKDLDEKIAILHDTTQTDSTINKGTVVGGYSNSIFDLYKTGYLNQAPYRIAYVINELKPQFRYLSIEERNMVAEGVQPEYRESISNTALQGIDGDIVSKRYKEVFGEKLSHEGSESCYTYLYNSTNNFYYENPVGGCGGISSYKTFHYKNKYTIEDNNAYVYIAVALSNAEDGNVYCDLSYLDISGVFKLAEDAKVCGTVSGNEDFALNESNYQDFAQYRFVFNKANDGTYYFSKVEKL